MDGNNTERKFVDKILTSLVESYYADGLLNDKDITSRKKALTKILNLLSEDYEIEMVTDHRQDILDKARNHKDKKDYQSAVIFYATYIEHEFNGLIKLYCNRNNIGAKVSSKIIRNINMEGKSGWFLDILGYPKLTSKYKTIFSKVSDERNAFIHYKWLVEKVDKNKERLNLDDVDKAITYLRRYVSRVELNGNKKRIKEMMKKD